METISSKLAHHISSNDISNEEQIIVTYGLSIIVELLLNTLTSIVIAIYFDMLVEMIVFTLSFFSLRRYAGGIHAKNTRVCYLFSVVLITCVLFL